MVKSISNKTYLNTKLIFSFLLIGIVLQIIIFVIFHFITIKSEQMMKHRTTLKYEIKNIQYNLSESHLWLHEFLTHDSHKKENILSCFQNIENSFENINKLIQPDNKIDTTKICQHSFIIETIDKLYQQYSHLKQNTHKYLLVNSLNKTIFDDEEYNKLYSETLQKIDFTLTHLEDTFLKVQKEFQIQKQELYILIIALIVLTGISIILIIRYQKNKYLEEQHKDALLTRQTKLADMGQMMDSIAHQWKGPLNIISMRVQMLELDISDKTLTEEKVITTIDQVQYQIRHLLETMDEFRKFFQPEAKRSSVSLHKICESILVLLHDELVKNTINISIDCKKDSKIFVNQNEIKHVIINLVLNSKDAFFSNFIEPSNRKINIILDSIENNVLLIIEDNAGGIPKNIINKIFDSRFTTKAMMGGTGIGLYLSKQIIEKNEAEINVESTNGITRFIISFSKDQTAINH